MVELTIAQALGLEPTPQEFKAKTQPPKEKPPTPAGLKRHAIQERIITQLQAGLNIDTICTKENITKPTLYTYVGKWAKTQQTTWLQTEWIKLYTQILQTNPTEAFRNLTKILCIIKRQQDKIELNIQNNPPTNLHLNLTQQIKTLIDISEMQCNANSNPNPKEP